MTKEEVRISTRKLCEDFEPMDDIGKFIRGVALSALDALEEANREIERLRHETRDRIVCRTRIELNNGVEVGCHTVYKHTVYKYTVYKAVGESKT